MTMPLVYQWDGEAMRPISPFLAKQADRQFVIGERYRLAEEQERSAKSHSHEFAWLKEAWENLPERYANDFPSPEHLRKRALIDAGFYDEQIADAGSNAAAIRMARFIGSREEFSVCVVRGPLVIVRTAKSQSRRTMKADEFQRSKTAIMEVVADLLGTDPKTLERAQAA
ncbi:hypothetical protein [Aureimonas glaciei]|uniref:Uncharacterized protein n=1 Tax=Aureimonas glaciei TaxID=1776957 RepID=A0A917D7L2_9HYPH|nr:hypothetical protein [Aureimonas glaciei]GGD11822.1 hypothetical protein GCM10011335_13490 [Aureimonas glaciei]